MIHTCIYYNTPYLGSVSQIKERAPNDSCMYVCMCVCMYVYICWQAGVHALTNACIYVYTHDSHVYMHIHSASSISFVATTARIFIYACIRTCIHVSTYIHRYILPSVHAHMFMPHSSSLLPQSVLHACIHTYT
jgi:hypothetical protein